MSGKASKAEVAQRVEAVFALRLGGAGFDDIRQYAAAPTDSDGKPLEPWGVSDTQLWRYIRAADQLCKERFDAKADHLLARHLLRRERLYAHALEVGDFKTALAILKDEAALEGHYRRDDGAASLETLLAALPPALAAATRAALAAMLAGAGTGGGGKPPPGGPAPGSGADPDAGGADAGLVAGGTLALGFTPDAAAVQPPGG